MYNRKFIIEFWCWEVKIELYGEKMKFIEWFIRLVRQDMKNYEEDVKIKKCIYITARQKMEKERDDR